MTREHGLVLAARGGLLTVVGSEVVQVVSAPSPPGWSLLTAGGGAVIVATAIGGLVLREEGARGGRLRSALRQVLPSGRGKEMLSNELDALRSLGLWVRGRKVDVRPGDQPVDYHRSLRTTILALVGLSVLEIMLVHLLIPIAWLRVVLLLLGVYGSVFAMAYLAGLAVRPHVFTAQGILLRFGSNHALRLSWCQVESLGPRLASRRNPSGLAIADGVASLAVGGSTNLALRLNAPLHLVMKDAEVLVHEVRFYADDPGAAVAGAARARKAAEPGDD